MLIFLKALFIKLFHTFNQTFNYLWLTYQRYVSLLFSRFFSGFAHTFALAFGHKKTRKTGGNPPIFTRFRERLI